MIPTFTKVFCLSKSLGRTPKLVAPNPATGTPSLGTNNAWSEITLNPWSSVFTWKVPYLSGATTFSSGRREIATLLGSPNKLPSVDVVKPPLVCAISPLCANKLPNTSTLYSPPPRNPALPLVPNPTLPAANKSSLIVEEPPTLWSRPTFKLLNVEIPLLILNSWASGNGIELPSPKVIWLAPTPAVMTPTTSKSSDM